eukprot:Blabericola_migrator_1__9055@NODE_481_length_8138_cov_55_758146_g374_i0_p3_GENE_NODE_481_length_8138_cov_55_758146_g374_i0NODE_481_length_8138_cov_55_758146_g374_i0_p3_ORF_typecomplete_len399_score31_73Nuc_sug_transp/PF04142_15/1_8e25CRTlike/PF08627_10/1_1e24SLC35F/PF06027_12/1_7e24UAA/PF08449_11/4_2e14TPT/PF03151_16/2_9e10PUNUT/PF16913_5/5_2e07EamA/PF00892_20/1_9e05EamA/PF00892_20/9_7e03Mg_trans_NIPA/PF05653_14/1_2e02Mg_trans_NIPA/PF05653_14/3_NODE_481_length_8138_cov_55_758146_g374_i060477243
MSKVTTDPPPQTAPTGASWKLWVSSTIVLWSGLATILLTKWQNRHYMAPCEGCAPTYYQHPYWQTYVMFAAEACCLGVHWIDQFIKRKKNKALGALEFPAHSWSVDREPVPWWWFGLPSFMDLMGTSMVNFAFAMTYASTVQMLRNSLVLVTAGMSMILMRRPLIVYEWIGIVVMTGGMVLSGMEAILRPDLATNTDPAKSWLGIVLTLVGTVLNAGTIISEEWMLKRRYCPPFRAVGWCGLTGLAWNTIAFPIVSVMGIDNMTANLYMLSHSQSLAWSQLLYLVSSATFNGFGMIVTKVGTGLLKGTLYACRAPLMWIFELTWGWAIFTYLNLAGFTLTFGGFFLFANMVPMLPFATFRKWYSAEVPCFCTRPMAQLEAEHSTGPPAVTSPACEEAL